MTGNLSYAQRVERHKNIDEGYFRSSFRRDRDRVRYSRYFRRLSGVTQVAHADESQLYHNRLTHSLKVAQLASALSRVFLMREGAKAEYTNGQTITDVYVPDEDSLATSLNPYVVEAAAHAHDIGHPPFGHRGEAVLNNLVDDASGGDAGFEGNAQSFRIVAQLTHRSDDRGSNLTRATLNAMIKYPWDRDDEAAKDSDGEPDKWGYYTDPGTDDEAVFNWARDPLENRDGQQVLEAQIMDWADDITYAIHDLQDFFKTGLIPIDELISEAAGRAGSADDRVDELALSTDDELDDFETYLDTETSVDISDLDVAKFFTRLAENFVESPSVIMRPFDGSHEDRIGLKKFTSRLVSRYMEVKRKNNPRYVRITQDGDNYNLDISDGYEQQVEVLKSLTEYYVISSPTLMQQQHGQEQILRNLFHDLMEEAKKTQKSHFPRSAIPSPYREQIKRAADTSEPIYRLVTDLIASLTEQQAISLHRRLRGWTPGTIQRDIIG